MLIVEFRTDMRLGKRALSRAPGTTIRNEEEYIHDGGADFIFWAEGGDFEAFEAGLEDDPTITNSRRMAETDGRRLYRATATREALGTTTLPMWSDLDLVLLDAEGTHDGWSVRMRFPTRDALDRYRRVNREHDSPFELEAIYDESITSSPTSEALTETQREALVAAYEAGYFDVPRTTSQEAVAETLDISAQSLSERLRRGTAAVVETSLV